jgi:hypothetical protein
LRWVSADQHGALRGISIGTNLKEISAVMSDKVTLEIFTDYV